MKRFWIPVAMLTLILIAYQNCSAPLEETTEADTKLRVLSSPTPIPTAPPKYSTPTPTPAATPRATPIPTPIPTATPPPGPETVTYQRFFNPQNGDHYLAPVNSNVPGWNAEPYWFKFYKNPGPNRHRVYQCEYAGYHMITLRTDCETPATGSRFGNPQDLGVYVSYQQNDETNATVQVFRKALDYNIYNQLPTLEANEGQALGYSQAAGFGWIPQ